MLLSVLLICIAAIFFMHMAKNFYMYRKRSDKNTIGKMTLFSAIIDMVLGIAMVVFAILLTRNKASSFAIQYKKIPTGKVN